MKERTMRKFADWFDAFDTLEAQNYKQQAKF